MPNKNGADMTAFFSATGQKLADPPELIASLLKLVPTEVLEAEVGHDALTKVLRYKYGNPFTDVAGHTVFGTHQLPEPWQLYVAVRAARRYLTDPQLRDYLARLKDVNKHADALLEMRPVGGLPPHVKPCYEIPGRSGRHIDWDLRVGLVHVRFDVKNRVKGAINHMKDVVAVRDKGDFSVPAPTTDPEAFFSSTETKFRRNFSPLAMQGVWAHVHIKENRKVLEDYFRGKVDRFRIDFLIIAGWTDESFVLARSSRQKEYLKRLFRLRETMNYVF